MPSLKKTSKHIFLIEPCDDLRNTITALLEYGGYQVTPLDKAEGALGLAALHMPDAVVAETYQTQIDMNDLCRQLRSLPSMSECRMVALTGYCTPESTDEMLQAGFHAVLLKPASVEELFRAIG